MPGQGLAWLLQDDFSAGAIRSVARHLIPANGVYDILNGLLDEDGSIYRRGGTQYLASAFGVRLSWLWSGHLVAGPRTVFSNGTGFGGSFGVLAADGVTPIDLGGTGLNAPVKGAVVNGMLFIPGGTIYGGSRKTADYNTGTITTNGTRTVIGTGTAWLANVDPGMLLRGTTRYHVVASVDSDTQLTLVDAWEEPPGTAPYSLVRLGSTALTSYRTADHYATIAERLITLEGSRIYFSNGRDELGVLKPHVFTETDYHELPQGSLALGADAVGDLLVVFTTDGVWTINNMAFDLTDAAGNVQQQMQRTSQDLVLWHESGIASYRGALVVPAVDGVYLVDGVTPPVSLSLSVAPLLAEHGRANDDHRPGGAAVFGNHYFLPILDGGPPAIDMLVCRLDRPTRQRSGVFFPWVRLDAHALVSALVQRVDATSHVPELLGAGDRLLKLDSLFKPDAAHKVDADGTAHSLAWTTRDFPTGRGNENTVRRVRLRYDLTRVSPDTPTITATVNVGGSTSDVPLTGAAPFNDGTTRYEWLLQARARDVRATFTSTGAAARLVIRSAEIAVRPSGKDR